MSPNQNVYVLGAGAVGLPLAVHLVNAGRKVVAVGTSRADLPGGSISVSLHDGANRSSATIDTVSLPKLAELDGIVVITAKSYANSSLAAQLADRSVKGPIVILQNGIGVEQPFLDRGFAQVYRCVLYVTSQPSSDYDYFFRIVASSPIGVVAGSEGERDVCVELLNTDGFPFHAEADIGREVWRKVIVNSVFNSICPLLETDNGIFVRDAAVADLAREVVNECLAVTERLKLGLTGQELMEQILMISRRSDGQLISTLQDIRMGRQTEMEFLNLGIARRAAALQPPLSLPRTELLGRLTLAKSERRKHDRPTP